MSKLVYLHMKQMWSNININVKLCKVNIQSSFRFVLLSTAKFQFVMPKTRQLFQLLSVDS